MIGFSTFSGETPRTAERLLSDNSATYAMNTRLENGSLVPLRESGFEESLNFFGQTIYKHKGKWMGWDKVVNVAPAPVAEDRIYVTGDGVPKVIIGGATYPLKVPAPTLPLGATVAGVPDPALSSSILYAYTFVTEFDEESEPSALGADVLWSPGLTVTVDGFEMPAAGRGINRQRIYRSQTSALGVTQLYFVHERPVSVAVFIEVPSDNPLQEPVSSGDFNGPPDDLAGIKAGPGGMMAAFSGKKLYFSEPYKPHAWPEKYVLTTNYNIVSVEWFDSSLAILTEGSPYIAQGLTPESMGMERIKVNLPCIAPLGVVNMGYSVIYPSNEGLVMVSSGGASVITSNLFTKEQWYMLAPHTIIAGHYASKYLMAYTANGQSESEVLIMDISGTPFISRAKQNCQAMFNEIGTGDLHMLRDGFDIYRWDSPDQRYTTQTWRSKPFVMPGHITLGVCMVECDPIDDAGEFVKVRIFADGREMVVTRPNTPVRLPSGFRAARWQVEISSNIPVATFRIASGMDDLIGG